MWAWDQYTCDGKVVKAQCWKPPGHYLCMPEPGRPDCLISIEIGVNGDAYPVAISPKVTKNLPVSFYSPTSGFKDVIMVPPKRYIGHIKTPSCT